MGGGGMGGFLGQAAMAAAGVAGGMFLFNGIEHLMNGGKESVAAQEPPADAAHASDSSADTAPASQSAAADQAPADDTTLADAGDAAADDGGWFDDGGFFGGDDELV